MWQPSTPYDSTCSPFSCNGKRNTPWKMEEKDCHRELIWEDCGYRIHTCHHHHHHRHYSNHRILLLLFPEDPSTTSISNMECHPILSRLFLHLLPIQLLLPVQPRHHRSRLQTLHRPWRLLLRHLPIATSTHGRDTRPWRSTNEKVEPYTNQTAFTPPVPTKIYKRNTDTVPPLTEIMCLHHPRRGTAVPVPLA